MGADACDHVFEPRLAIDAVEPSGTNERLERRGAFASGIGTPEQPVLSSKSNRAVILPISGRISLSTILGIRCLGEVRAAFWASGVQLARSYISSVSGSPTPHFRRARAMA
jgi:hypothetical protein